MEPISISFCLACYSAVRFVGRVSTIADLEEVLKDTKKFRDSLPATSKVRRQLDTVIDKNEEKLRQKQSGLLRSVALSLIGADFLEDVADVLQLVDDAAGTPDAKFNADDTSGEGIDPEQKKELKQLVQRFKKLSKQAKQEAKKSSNK